MQALTETFSKATEKSNYEDDFVELEKVVAGVDEKNWYYVAILSWAFIIIIIIAILSIAILIIITFLFINSSSSNVSNSSSSSSSS